MNPTGLALLVLLFALSRSSAPSDGFTAVTPDTPPPAPAGRVAQGHVNGQLVDLVLVTIDAAGHELRADAAAAFGAMRDAAAAAGVALQVNSAFRTFEQQAALYAQYVAGTGNLAAPAGWSNHEGGVAVDVESGSGTNAAFNWLTANASSYRFKRTVVSEPWHWEYS